jgi:tetratricopeptide (TPR) repeat protein
MSGEVHTNGAPDERTARLLDVLEECLAELEQGGRPCADALAERHPDLADVLPDYLRELEELCTAAPPGDEPVPAVPPARGRLGDFRLLRELGRGGMGVVYEAEQLSLGRRVALKVLPLAATLDARQLLRFKHEAQAAACLHHPHIVPVYGVGCERGVHYYAMQFIEGHSLAEVIADLRAGDGASQHPTAADGSTPTGPAAALSTERSARSPAYCRAVARVGVQAAEALEHAHQVGIVHRDIKPANLLLDAAAQVWVTDFGLARCRTAPELTPAGDAVGTLRYMSPEQALGKRGLVDHRSDVYGLGVTLYELLTLEPAHAGTDREELLRQIAQEEPRPLRRLNPAVPVELETVVLKAMAREPAARYATAGELADDLRRFLEDQPIRAVRPGLAARGRRWLRRHRGLAAAAGVIAMLALAGLLVATVLVWREQRLTKAALAEAQAEGARAEVNFRRALEGVNGLLWRLEEPRWINDPKVQEVRVDLTRRGLEFLQKFVEDGGGPAVRFQAGRTYVMMADVYCGMKQLDRAQEAQRRAVGLFEELVADYPAELAYSLELGRIRWVRGIWYRSLGHPTEARAEFAAAVEAYRTLLPLDTDGRGYNNLACLLCDGPEEGLRDVAAAVPLAREAVARGPQRWAYWNTLGVALYRAGDWRGAITALETGMARKDGGDAHDWYLLALAHARLGEREEARRWVARAVRWAEEHRSEVDESLCRYRAEAEALGIRH